MASASQPEIVTDVPVLPPRPATMHKGQAGHAAIVAGSPGMSGAAVLCGLGALRGGAGLVRVVCDADIQPLVAASEPSLMTYPIASSLHDKSFDRDAFRADVIDWATALAVGPGLGATTLALSFARCWLEEFTVPLVLDADGLNTIARCLEWADQVAVGTPPGPELFRRWWELRRGAPTIVTPHPGEMARLRWAAGMPPLHGDDDEARVRIAPRICHAEWCGRRPERPPHRRQHPRLRSSSTRPVTPAWPPAAWATCSPG